MSGLKELVCFLAICLILLTWIMMFFEQPIVVTVNSGAWCVLIYILISDYIKHRNS